MSLYNNMLAGRVCMVAVRRHKRAGVQLCASRVHYARETSLLALGRGDLYKHSGMVDGALH